MPGPINQILFDKMAIPRLETVLDLAASRQKLLTDNVANAETPGYRRKDIDFKGELKAALSGARLTGLRVTNERHIGGQTGMHTPRIDQEKIPAGQNFGVDIDREMAAVAENQIEFNTAAKLVKDKFEALRKVIRGRT
jgi:flagellar basal-body rod protein FlgB